jgi:DnaJ domain
MTSSSRPSNRYHGRVPRHETCAIYGCPHEGEFRAPLSHRPSLDGPQPWRWLCLEHIREFNASYDYFAGMSADQIYAAQTPMHGWETESRTFRAAGSADLPPRWADFKDPIDAIGARFRQRMDAAREEQRQAADPRFTREEHRALKVMGLTAECDRRTLRRRYADLVRRYHPDRNGGDRSHEKALQAVIEAYTALAKAQAFA